MDIFYKKSYIWLSMTGCMALIVRNEEIAGGKRASNEHKYQNKINSNILVGTVKDRFVSLLLITNTRKRDQLLNNIINQISGSIIPIRPNRQNPRKFGCVRSKYKTNHKRCL